METTNYHISLDPEIKTEAEKTFAEFGLKLSDAINVFLHMSIKQRGFPFALREPQLKSEVLLAIQESEQIISEYASGMRIKKSFANARELFNAMDAEDEAESADE